METRRVYRMLTTFLVICAGLSNALSEKDWYDYFLKKGTACKDDTCGKNDTICECYLTIDHDLTLMYKGQGSPAVLLKPQNGKAVNFNTGQRYDEKTEETFILADGYRSRLVITVNGRFPGPAITAYEYQEIHVHVRNLMLTDAITIHWHGMLQKKTPWSDGVAFVTECPLLPGQNYTYIFTGKPFGTSFYHAHIADQRTMGLYGPLIIIPISGQNISLPQEGGNVFILSLQDWNHDDDYDVLYQKMIWGVYNLDTGILYNTTSDLSGAMYSRFRFHSGLINGRGRYYFSSDQNNGSPLSKFIVRENEEYRFRVISAATLYPFRVFVQNHKDLRIVASDGFEIRNITVESFIIHPGERIDFILRTNQPADTYLLVAETLEVGMTDRNEYHAAEAIIYYNSSLTPMNLNPAKVVTQVCKTTCYVFNCPFLFYPMIENRKCITFNDVQSDDPNSHTEDVEGDAIEYFFNFAFPGDKSYTPGSVNGHQFLPPRVGAYAQPDLVDYNCDACNATTICECTYAVTLNSSNTNQVYQFVLTNIGNGSGWSHPIHFHGHSFYVMKMVFAKYDQDTGKLLKNMGQDKFDIICNDSSQFCSEAEWKNSSWKNGRHPSLNWNNPPQKDTIIVPTGSYVVIRFKAGNPGIWFFHCHIDLHNTNGMGMIINELPKYQPSAPKDFPKCGNVITEKANTTDGNTIAIAYGIGFGIGIVIGIIIYISFHQFIRNNYPHILRNGSYEKLT